MRPRLPKREVVVTDLAWKRRWPGRPFVVWHRVSRIVKARRVPRSDLVKIGLILQEVEMERRGDP